MDAQMDAWPGLLHGGSSSVQSARSTGVNMGMQARPWRRDVTIGQPIRWPLAQVQRLAERSSLPHLSNRLFGRFSIVGTQPFLDLAGFLWTALLEEPSRPCSMRMGRR